MVAWDVSTAFLGRVSFSEIPAGEIGCPVRIEAGKTTLSEMFDEVFRRKAKDSSDSGKV